MLVKSIAFAALLAGSAYAQDTSDTTTSPVPTSTSSISPCVLTCVESSTLCTFTDATCVCSNTQYQQAVASCLTTNCTAADQAEAQALEAELCGSSSSGSPSSTTTTPAKSSGASSVLSSASSKASSPSSSPSSGSGNGAAGFSASILATGGAVLLGVIGGGLLVF